MNDQNQMERELIDKGKQPQEGNKINNNDDSNPILSMEKKVALKDVRKAREQIETDVKLLANRVAALMHEDMKTQKKIRETQKKTNEILKKKQDEERELKNKEKYYKKRIENNEKSKTHFQEESKQLQTRIAKNITQVYETKKSNAYERKSLKIGNLQAKSKNIEEMIKNNYMKKTIVKYQEEQTLAKINKLKEEKLKRSQDNYLKKVVKEQNKILTKEEELEKLENLEKELLEKIQNTRTQHDTVISELQNVMSKVSPTKQKVKELRKMASKK